MIRGSAHKVRGYGNFVLVKMDWCQDKGRLFEHVTPILLEFFVNLIYSNSPHVC